MDLSSRDGYCGLWPVGSPYWLGSPGVATAPTTAGGTPEKGLSLGAEVKRGVPRVLGQRAATLSTPSWFVLGLRGGWVVGDANTQASAVSRSQTGVRTSLPRLSEQATDSHPLGSLACDHEQVTVFQ